MENLEGKTAFVTGASQGIGRACAHGAGKNGRPDRAGRTQ